MDQYNCLGCDSPYSTNNPPLRLRNCFHRLCQSCLEQNLECPIDGSTIDCRKSGKFIDLDLFPIDAELLSKAIKSNGGDYQRNKANKNAIRKTYSPKKRI